MTSAEDAELQRLALAYGECAADLDAAYVAMTTAERTGTGAEWRESKARWAATVEAARIAERALRTFAIGLAKRAA